MSKRLRSSEVCADCSGPGELRRPGPLPSTPLTRTAAPGPPPGVRRSRRPSPALRARGRGKEEPRRPEDGSRLGPGRHRRGGGRRPLVPLPSLSPCPLCPGPSREATGPGLLLQQEGAWAVRGKASTEVLCGRAPPAAPGGCRCRPSLPPPPLASRSPAPRGGSARRERHSPPPFTETRRRTRS